MNNNIKMKFRITGHTYLYKNGIMLIKVNNKLVPVEDSYKTEQRQQKLHNGKRMQ